MVRQLAVLAAALTAAGCNSIAGINVGMPRPICVDPLMIDDMEDGEAQICASNGRLGAWYTVTDGTSSDLLEGFPAMIPARRDTSRYAAHFAGSAFTEWGALMGFGFTDEGLASKAYDASTTGGIKFWMKSTAPVSVNFLLPETVLRSEGGDCVGGAADSNCNSHFSFRVTAPSSDWVEYEVPYLALRQQFGGSATWNPRSLLGVQFLVDAGTTFDVWVDDVRFYYCSTSNCLPTCADPDFLVACPASSRYPATCRPTGIDCAVVVSWCTDPLLIDDMEDGEGTICESGGRHGGWWVATDGTSTDLKPAVDTAFEQTSIPGGRGNSHFAARLTGSGFSGWGAAMGLTLNVQPASTKTYDASTVDGIKLWMKSDVPVTIEFGLPATIPISNDSPGTCDANVAAWNCFNHFQFDIGVNGNDWVEYDVPFAALGQSPGVDAEANFVAGSATWDPSRLVSIHFTAHSSAFDLWVDDLRFYTCGTGDCLPTCSADAPMACPASGGRPAGCWPAGTNCAAPPDLVTNTGVWGSGRDDVWVVGYSASSISGSILHWNGTTWSSATSRPTPPIWAGVWGSGPDDAWAVADHGVFLRWDGTTWSDSASGTNASFNDTWGSGPDDVWAIAYPNAMLHWNGSVWSPFPTTIGTTDGLWGVWGTGPNDVWAVGDKGALLHFDGSAWSASASGTTATLNAVWGSDTNDVWAVGGAGTVLHRMGSAWTAVASGTQQFLSAVWGSGPGDVWAVGDKGTILHWNGSAWSPVPSGTSQLLRSVWGSGPDDVWAVGDANTILHWNGSTWSPVMN